MRDDRRVLQGAWGTLAAYFRWKKATGALRLPTPANAGAQSGKRYLKEAAAGLTVQFVSSKHRYSEGCVSQGLASRDRAFD